MRKVFANKWFILASSLTISLSAFSYATYKKACEERTPQCYQKSCESGDKTDYFWDFITGQIPSVSIR